MTTEQINSIIVYFELGQEYFVWQMSEDVAKLDADERLEMFYEEVVLEDTIDSEEHEKIVALMEHTGEDWDDVESQVDSGYLVLTDDEADELLDERLENYIDECILCTINKAYHYYFNREAWKSDNDSDRGFWIDYESGTEDEERVNGTVYFIYKQ